MIVAWLLQNCGVNDLRAAMRGMLKSPGFTIMTTLILALGIGANTAIFLFANALFLRPLPGIEGADRLAIIKPMDGNREAGGGSYADFHQLRRENSVFIEVAACLPAALSLGAEGSSERVLGEFVSENFFRALGVRMAAGRDFLPEENVAPGRNPVAIISHQLWMRRWNGDRAVVGQEIRLNGRAVTIVGVAGKGFRGAFLPTARQIWVPAQMQPLLQSATAGVDLFTDHSFIDQWRLVSRLKPNETLERADASLDLFARSLADANPSEKKDRTFRAFGYNPAGLARTSQIALFLSILWAMSVLTLTIVCANVANLFIARMQGRLRECSIRLALGASRFRVALYTLHEPIVIALSGAVSAIWFAFLAADFLFRRVPGDRGEQAAVDLVVDWRVCAFALLLGIFCVFAAGIVPAIQFLRRDSVESLRVVEKAPARGRSNVFSLLVIAQIALCVVLLISASLIFKSVSVLESVDSKIPIREVIVASIDPALNGYDESRARQFYIQLLERLRSTPGVEASSLGRVTPFGGSSTTIGQAFFGGAISEGNAFKANGNFVSDGYFKTLTIPMLIGRDVLKSDTREQPRVIIVNQTLAARLWPSGSAVGKKLFVKPFDNAQSSVAYEVISVVGDSIYADVSEMKTPKPFFYVPFAQHGGIEQNLHVRSTAGPGVIAEIIRGSVASLDPNIPVFNVRTLSSVRELSFAPQRIATELVTFSGSTSMALALMGLTAVMLLEVRRRTREIGIRTALGAAPAIMIGWIVRRGLVLSGIGLLAGLALALIATKGLSSILYGVNQADPITYLATAVFVFLSCSLACYMPARRVATIDPVNALRHE
jgi:predicted permease